MMGVVIVEKANVGIKIEVMSALGDSFNISCAHVS
jgi:hypothetical protein